MLLRQRSIDKPISMLYFASNHGYVFLIMSALAEILFTFLSKELHRSNLVGISVYRDKANMTIRGANTEATSDMTVIIVLREGPAVSLNGSPTVSPTTAAL